jgi:hypothetical protein
VVCHEFPDDINIAEKYWKMIATTQNLQKTARGYSIAVTMQDMRVQTFSFL